MRDLTVATVMTKDPVVVAPDTEFKDIVQILAKHAIRAVPVVGGDGVPVGVVSETDLTRKQETPSVLDGRKAAGERARDLMSVRVLAVDVGASVNSSSANSTAGSAAAVRAGPRPARRCGVSRRDLLKVFLRSDDEIRLDVGREVFQRVLWADVSTATVSVARGVVTLTGRM